MKNPARSPFAIGALGTLAATALLALAACGKSVDANQSATADTVEIPAEQAMAGATAMPTDMATGEATEDAAAPSDAGTGAE